MTGLPDVVSVAIGVVVLGGALATFFLSLLRLHRQTVEAKRASSPMRASSAAPLPARQAPPKKA